MNIYQEEALHKFCQYWQKKVQTNEEITEATERSDTQRFWLELIYDVLGAPKDSFDIEFEKKINIIRTGGGYEDTSNKSGSIDVYIPKTQILIEQKDCKKDLTKKIRQSDDTHLTPYEQAKRYYDNLMFSEKGRYIITCNFKEFRIYDLDQKIPEQIIKLSDLENEIYRLEFLVKNDASVMTREEKLSFDAGALIGKLYKHLLTLYKNSDDPNVANSSVH